MPSEKEIRAAAEALSIVQGFTGDYARRIARQALSVAEKERKGEAKRNATLEARDGDIIEQLRDWVADCPDTVRAQNDVYITLSGLIRVLNDLQGEAKRNATLDQEDHRG